MKNKITDLNNHLFAQIERLSDEDLTAEQIALEVSRAKAVVAVSDQIIAAANVHLDAAKMVAQYGSIFKSELPMLEQKPAQAKLSA